MRPALDDHPVLYTSIPHPGQRVRVRVRNDKDEDEDEDDVQDTIGFVGEVVEPMCDEDDRLARAALAERGDDVALGDGIQRGRRFVDDDESRRAMTEAHERARAACTDGMNGCTHARKRGTDLDLRGEALLFAA